MSGVVRDFVYVHTPAYAIIFWGVVKIAESSCFLKPSCLAGKLTLSPRSIAFNVSVSHMQKLDKGRV
jgi:hypothetical protein